MTQISNDTPLTPKQAAGCCGPIDRVLDPELFKALGDPTRALLFGCLVKCRRPCTVSEVAECCAVDFSVVSRHLQMLERAGVLESNKQGRKVSYRVRHAHLGGVLRDLAAAIEACGEGSAEEGGCCGAC